MMLSLACDHVAAFTLWPHGPERTTVFCDFLFHPEEMAKAGFDPSDAVDFWDLVNWQDWAICKRVQQGSSSRMHKFGYYAPMEDLSLDIRNYVLSRLKWSAAATGVDTASQLLISECPAHYTQGVAKLLKNYSPSSRRIPP